jgi:hypothetical protein
VKHTIGGSLVASGAGSTTLARVWSGSPMPTASVTSTVSSIGTAGDSIDIDIP